MTGKTHALSSDQALAALALVEAHNERNDVNIRNIIRTTDWADLTAGMVTLVCSLTVSLAAATGVQPADIEEQLRALLFVHAEMDDA